MSTMVGEKNLISRAGWLRTRNCDCRKVSVKDCLVKLKE